MAFGANFTLLTPFSNTSESNYLIDGTSARPVKYGVTLKDWGSFPEDRSITATLKFTSSDTTEGVVGKVNDFSAATETTSLTFNGANWNKAQTLYIFGVDDMDDAVDIAYNVVAAIDSSNTIHPGYNENDIFIPTNKLFNLDDGMDNHLTNVFGLEFDNDTTYTSNNDFIQGRNGDDILSGGDRGDIIKGGYGHDNISGDKHDDTLYGQQGDDTLKGGEHDDTLYGDEGNDKLFGEQDNDTLYGGRGDDYLDGGVGADRMLGGHGSDTYVVDDVNDKIQDFGLKSDTDTVHVEVTASATGEAYTYVLAKNLEDAAITATNGNGGLTGNAQNNVLTGNGGRNQLNGGFGTDFLDGGAGADTLNGGAGKDTMEGGTGNDVYIVNSSADVVVESNNGGGWGFDTVRASASFSLTQNVEKLVLTGKADISATGNGLGNVINGNTGDNVIKAGGGADTVVSGWGNDTVNSGTGNDKVVAGRGNDKIIAGLGNDKVNGDAGNDTVLSGWGNDIVDGGTGNDIIRGDAGNDVLTGGAGNDVLTGGAGADIFILSDKAIDANTDKITDFNVRNDTIHLENKFYSKVGAADKVLKNNFFRVGSEAEDSNDYIIYNQETGSLSYDADGNGSGQAHEIANIGANLNVTNNDFFVV